MKTPIKMFFLAGVIWTVSSMIGCSREMPPGIDGNSGGSTSDVDGVLCGVLYEPGGNEPARGASVVLRPRNYLPVIQILSKRTSADSIVLRSTITDNKGFYSFHQVPEGIYCIEGRDDTNNRVLIDSVNR